MRFEEKLVRSWPKIIIFQQNVWSVMTPNCLTAIFLWPVKRWIAALGIAVATFLIIGLPTAVISNPVFGRAIGVTDWSLPVLLAISALSGLLFATYVRIDPSIMDSSISEENSVKVGSIGGFLAYLAVGCPVCNKIVLIALGSTGAIQYFAPVQPYLGAAGLLLLIYALHKRLVNEAQCSLPNPEKITSKSKLKNLN